MNARTLSGLVIGGAICLAANTGYTQDQWQTGGDGIFSSNNNWVDNSAPTLFDRVEFSIVGSDLVSFASDVATKNLTINQGDLTFQSSGGMFGYTITNEEFASSLWVASGSLTLGTIGGSLDIITQSAFVSAGATLNVAHGSTVTGTSNSQTGASGMVVAGVLEISEGGELNAHEMRLWPGGAMTVGSTGGGTLSGSDIVIGGTLTILPGSTYAATPLQIEPGGLAEIGVDLLTTTIDGGQLEIAGTLRMTHGASLSLEGSPGTPLHGVLDVSGDLNMAATGTTVFWNAEGGQILVAGDTNIGEGGPLGTGNISLRNGTDAQLATLNLGASASTSGNADLTVEFSSVETDDINIGSGDGGNSRGSLLLSNGRVTQRGAATLTIGGQTNSTGRVSVAAGSQLQAGGGGTILNSLGQISLTGGTADLGTLVQNGGLIFFDAGELVMTADVTIGEDGLFDEDVLQLSDQHELELTGMLTIDAFNAMQVNGGWLSVSQLHVDGAMHLNAGFVAVEEAGGLTVGGGPLSAQLKIDGTDPAVMTVAHGVTIQAGSELDQRGGRLDADALNILGRAVVSGGAVNIADATTVGSAANVSLSGGLLTTDSLQNGGTLTLAGASVHIAGVLNNQAGAVAVIGPSSVLEVDGPSTNAGDLLLGGDAARLRGAGTLANEGLLHGDGTVAMSVTNSSGGEVRARSGQLLRFEAANGDNEGRINLQGGTVEYLQSLTNGVDGLVTGRGTLVVGGAGLVNQGAMAFAAGTSDLFGDVNNAAGATIIASSNATLNFWDDVVHEGQEIKVAQGSIVTFFGALSGSGPINGTGEVFMEGDLSPGSSPGRIAFGGDLHFAAASQLSIELGGLVPVDQYDVVAVEGVATLNGALAVTAIDLGGGAFVPRAGNQFQIVTAAGGLSGTVASMALPALTGDLSWTVDYGTHALTLSVETPYSADFDGDGMVAASDLEVWQSAAGVNSDGDADSDGQSSGSDLLAWQRQLGAGMHLRPAARPIPEPAAHACMAVFALLLAARGSRPRNVL